MTTFNPRKLWRKVQVRPNITSLTKMDTRVFVHVTLARSKWNEIVEDIKENLFLFINPTCREDVDLWIVWWKYYPERMDIYSCSESAVRREDLYVRPWSSQVGAIKYRTGIKMPMQYEEDDVGKRIYSYVFDVFYNYFWLDNGRDWHFDID